MEKITAVDYLIEELGEQAFSHLSPLKKTVLIEESKTRQKEELQKAFNESRLTHPMIAFKHRTFEEYYIETYKSE
jgi:hypothetical protein